MKRKIAIIIGIVLIITIVAVGVIPVFAAGPAAGPQTPAQAAKMGVLTRLLLVQNEAKVDSLINQAKNNGKINDDQAVKIKEFWTDYHKQFTRKIVLTRLMRANDGAKVQAFLDKQVAANKLKPEQSVKIMALWTSLHSK